MDAGSPIHFDDTEIAFSYKTNRDLKKANLIFTLINNRFISAIATKSVKLALAMHLPVKSLIRNTVFEHFCGGETVDQSQFAIRKIATYHVGAILDYSVEGEETEAAFDHTTTEILRTFDTARGNSSVPFCVFKVTGLGSMDLLEKVQKKATLTKQEAEAYERVRGRVDKICSKAFLFEVPVLVDGEDSWIQDVIDDLAYEMMHRYNLNKTIVFNTYQMYRSDMLQNLERAYADAVEKKYFLGVKIVRGAYMEKERARAEKEGYPDPINLDKASTDDLFNKGLEFCIRNIDRISLVCGSHNEYSNQFLVTMMKQYAIDPKDGRVWFAQLLGMSDNISFNLAAKGYNVVKYVPFGPVESVMPYLLRRAAENTSVAGQSSRELLLIRKELKRRTLQDRSASI